MIISDRNKFVFIHIPKCAGTSVRSRIEHLDDRRGAYSSRLDEHPELGLLNYVHIPLSTLRDHFPHEYECVKAYRSLAIMRNPAERFVSSVSQYCNRYSDVEMRNHSIKTLRRQVDRLIELHQNWRGNGAHSGQGVAEAEGLRGVLYREDDVRQVDYSER